MKRVYELDVCKLAEELSDLVWQNFDKWNKKVQNTLIVKRREGQISNFQFLKI
jgi:hypothetical protein